MQINSFCDVVHNRNVECIKLSEGVIRARQIVNYCSAEAERGFTGQYH